MKIEEMKAMREALKRTRQRTAKRQVILDAYDLKVKKLHSLADIQLSPQLLKDLRLTIMECKQLTNKLYQEKVTFRQAQDK